VKYYVLRYIHSLILFVTRNNCLSSGRSLLLYQYTKRAIELTVVFIEHITTISYMQDCTQHPSLEVKSLCRRNYSGSSVWVSM
jgi:hypothetical protein